MKKIRKFLELRMPAGYDRAVHACIIVLMIFGSVMVVSTSVGESVKYPDIVIRTIIKQIVFIIVSYFMMTKIAVNFFRWKKMKGFNSLVKIAGFGVLALLLATQLFPGANGSKAWIYLPGNISLQPSEFAKVFMIVFFGLCVNRFAGRKSDLIQYLKEPMIFIVLATGLIYIQPDLGTLIVMALIFGTIFLIPSHYAIRPAQRVVKVVFILGLIALFFLSTPMGLEILEKFISSYKLGRFTNAQNPFLDLYNTGYNLVYSIYAIANGGIGGLGIGASKQKWGYLPEAETDFILSVTIEELGLFGLVIIVVCYAVILYRLYYYAKRTMSEGYRVILMGAFMYLTIHFVLNVGGISGLIPLTGVPLLFMSAGGSSILSISILLGVCQAIISMTKSQMKHAVANYKRL